MHLPGAHHLPDEFEEMVHAQEWDEMAVAEPLSKLEVEEARTSEDNLLPEPVALSMDCPIHGALVRRLLESTGKSDV